MLFFNIDKLHVNIQVTKMLLFYFSTTTNRDTMIKLLTILPIKHTHLNNNKKRRKNKQTKKRGKVKKIK